MKKKDFFQFLQIKPNMVKFLEHCSSQIIKRNTIIVFFYKTDILKYHNIEMVPFFIF